jgi:hypothetical protein
MVDPAKPSTALFVATIARWWTAAMVVVRKDPPLGSGGYAEEMTAGKNRWCRNDAPKTFHPPALATIARWWMGAIVVVRKDPPLGSGGYAEEMTAGNEIIP